MDSPPINYTAFEKLELYKIARQFFEDGLSHPQVVEKFIELNCNKGVAELIADKAFYETWDKLFDSAKEFYGKGKTYLEVIDILSRYEDDREVTRHIADTLYEVKTIEMENTIESPTNIFEGLKWVIASGIAIPIVFLLRLSLFAKIIWMLAFVAAAIQFAWGLRQRNLAKQVKKFMENEQD